MVLKETILDSTVDAICSCDNLEFSLFRIIFFMVSVYLVFLPLCDALYLLSLSASTAL